MGNASEIWTCPECGGTLDISEVGFYKEVSCPVCSHTEIVHTQLANFKLTGVLGIGGMSVVFNAKDLILNRPLAIKVLNDTYKDQPERIARFENECAMMAKVRHENVVDVYSAGWARGQFYIAMELVHGHDMEHVVSHGEPLLPTVALSVAREVALGLQAASQAGLLHRDMKPGNILISQNNGKAKVLDFGLSLGAQTEDTEEVIWATPFYVAPETLRREQEDVRTDIYALGMTLRYLLTGSDKLPSKYTSIPSLLEAKKKLPPFRETYPKASQQLADLVDHMTAFNVGERPPNYRELMQEMDEVSAIQSKEDGENTFILKSLRRRVLGRFLGGMLGGGLIGAAIVTMCSLPEEQPEVVQERRFDQWMAISRLEKGIEAVGMRRWDSAKDSFKSVLEQGADPALVAYSSLLLYYIALADNERGDMERYLNTFHEQMGRKEPHSPAADDMFKQMKIVDEILCGEKNEAALPGVKSPVLRGIVFASMVEQKAASSYVIGREYVHKAIHEWENAGPRLSSLASLMENLDRNLRSFCTSGHFVNAHKALLAHDFQKCNSTLTSLGAMPTLSEHERNRVEALREISAVAEAMVDVIKKRLPADYYKGMQPSVLRAAAAKLNEEGLDKEIFCLGLLMKGDYTSAFKYNPYASDEASTKPFAILMRHWEKMLFGIRIGFDDSEAMVPTWRIHESTPDKTVEAMLKVLWRRG